MEIKSVEELVAHKSTMYVSVATSSKEGRFGSLLKTKGGKRIINSLKKQLVFKINEIRAINF